MKASAGEYRMTISPLVNMDRKGGAYVIMLQQFKEAIGVAIAQVNTEHKMMRLHYVRETTEEATKRLATATTATSNRRQAGEAISIQTTHQLDIVHSSNSETVMILTYTRPPTQWI